MYGRFVRHIGTLLLHVTMLLRQLLVPFNLDALTAVHIWQPVHLLVTEASAPTLHCIWEH